MLRIRTPKDRIAFPIPSVPDASESLVGAMGPAAATETPRKRRTYKRKINTTATWVKPVLIPGLGDFEPAKAAKQAAQPPPKGGLQWKNPGRGWISGSFATPNQASKHPPGTPVAPSPQPAMTGASSSALGTAAAAPPSTVPRSKAQGNLASRMCAGGFGFDGQDDGGGGLCSIKLCTDRNAMDNAPQPRSELCLPHAFFTMPNHQNSQMLHVEAKIAKVREADDTELMEDLINDEEQRDGGLWKFVTDLFQHNTQQPSQETPSTQPKNATKTSSSTPTPTLEALPALGPPLMLTESSLDDDIDMGLSQKYGSVFERDGAAISPHDVTDAGPDGNSILESKRAKAARTKDAGGRAPRQDGDGTQRFGPNSESDDLLISLQPMPSETAPMPSLPSPHLLPAEMMDGESMGAAELDSMEMMALCENDIMDGFESLMDDCDVEGSFLTAAEARA